MKLRTEYHIWNTWVGIWYNYFQLSSLATANTVRNTRERNGPDMHHSGRQTVPLWQDTQFLAFSFVSEFNAGVSKVSPRGSASYMFKFFPWFNTNKSNGCSLVGLSQSWGGSWTIWAGQPWLKVPGFRKILRIIHHAASKREHESIKLCWEPFFWPHHWW